MYEAVTSEQMELQWNNILRFFPFPHVCQYTFTLFIALYIFKRNSALRIEFFSNNNFKKQPALNIFVDLPFASFKFQRQFQILASSEFT